MMDYVVVLTEKYDLLHMQLLDARQLIDKNHIVIERDKVDKVTVDSVDLSRPWEMCRKKLLVRPSFPQGPPKCRSISLICPPTTSTPEDRRISLVKQVKSLLWCHSKNMHLGKAFELW